MKKNFCKKGLLLALLFISLIGGAQVQEAWNRTYSYNGGSRDFATVTAVDASGNIYVTGASWRYDGDDRVDLLVTIKYDKNGNELWRRLYGGGAINDYIRPVAMVLDVSGNVYITSSGNTNNVYTTLKYASNGTFRWATRYAGFTDHHYGDAADIVVDGSGNIFVTGFVYFVGAIGNPDNFEYGEYVTIKYDIDGDQQWLKRFNGTSPGNGENKATAMAIDPLGNIYVTGASQLNGQLDYATVKYSNAGSQLWVQRYNGAGNGFDFANDIALDGANNVYVTGVSHIGDQDNDFATIKYDENGNQLWVKRYGGGSVDVGKCIKVDGNANVYVAGYGDSYPFNYKVVKYNTNGDQQWVGTYAGPGNADDEVTGMALDFDNNVYVTGISNSSITTVRFNTNNGTKHWSQSFNYLLSLQPYDPPMSIALDASGNVYVAGRIDPGGQSNPDLHDMILIRYAQCNIVCPASITVNNDAGTCGAVVNFADVTTIGDCGGSITYSHASGSTFPVGVTTVTVTSDETGASCSFTITVVDNELPVITYCPPGKTLNSDPGVCYVTAANVNAGITTATDNCSVSVAGIRSDGQSLTANYPGGITTISWTAIDGSNNTATCAQIITVVDNQPPVITGESASVIVLSPANHTMRDVTINYDTPTDNCSVTWVISVSSNEPVNGTGDGDTDPDYSIIDDHHVKLRAERSANGNGRIYTITITATDGSGNTAVKTVEVRVPHNIKNPHSGQAFKVGSTVAFEGEFWDKAGKTHTAKWLIDGSTIVKGVVSEPNGNNNGKVTGSYKFTAPGVYKLQMNVTDQNGITHYTNTAGDLEAIAVIYDPNGGYTYGGGYFNSPAGALTSDPTVIGKASYGFAMNYFKNSTYPKGETQFEFKVGSFEFNALNFEYLVISNSMSQFKGTGKIIGGQSGIGFTMTVVDGQLDGSGIDKIRMKIYNKNNGAVIYDNQAGASDAALPTQAVGSNSTIVISGTNSSLTSANTNQKADMEAKVPEISTGLDVIAFPNPSTNTFTINVKARTNERIIMQVTDMYGRIIETRNVKAHSTIKFGDRYRPGTYFARLMQGKEHKELKLIKLSD